MLLAADRASNTAITAELNTGKHTVGKWRERFSRLRTDQLRDEPSSGAQHRLGAKLRREGLLPVCHQNPPSGKELSTFAGQVHSEPRPTASMPSLSCALLRAECAVIAPLTPRTEPRFCRQPPRRTPTAASPK
ncbi:hypothetical protein [Methylorubrum rhodinum]|uniref:hypothetical protein n=1 Tax=Methylorubrum rhodinum TaxID=29428 RepID=UPI001AEDEDDC